MEEAAAQPQVQRRTTLYRNPLRYTNFYPLYNGANDQVDPVLRVQRVQFQRVLPRYRLSTSETRDQGVGPMFTEVPSIQFGRYQETEMSRDTGGGSATAAVSTVTPRGRAAGLEPWKGSRVDLYA
jgi:hypothetical protein